MGIHRYQDVIEDLFWAVNTLDRPGANVSLVNAALRGTQYMGKLDDIGSSLYDQQVRGSLVRSAPYFITTQVTELITASAASLPPETVLTESMFPTLNGYARQEDPMEQLPQSLTFCGVLWGWGNFDLSATQDLGTEPGIGEYLMSHGGKVLTTIGLFRVVPPQGYLSTLPLGSCMWPEGMPLGELIRLYKVSADHGGLLGTYDALRAMERLARFVGALALFMQQEIVVPKREPADRATRRRLEHAGVGRQAAAHQDCVVVRLRRISHSPPNPDATPRNWASRWWVGWPNGTWRVLYRGTPRQRVVYVRPYVKGPDVKPIKPPAMRVYELAR